MAKAKSNIRQCEFDMIDAVREMLGMDPLYRVTNRSSHTREASLPSIEIKNYAEVVYQGK